MEKWIVVLVVLLIFAVMGIAKQAKTIEWQKDRLVGCANELMDLRRRLNDKSWEVLRIQQEAEEAAPEARKRVGIAVKYQGRLLASMSASEAHSRALMDGGKTAMTPGITNGYDVIITAEPDPKGEETGNG